jgi:hypothetical protein
LNFYRLHLILIRRRFKKIAYDLPIGWDYTSQ